MVVYHLKETEYIVYSTCTRLQVIQTGWQHVHDYYRWIIPFIVLEADRGLKNIQTKASVGNRALPTAHEQPCTIDSFIPPWIKRFLSEAFRRPPPLFPPRVKDHDTSTRVNRLISSNIGRFRVERSISFHDKNYPFLFIDDHKTLFPPKFVDSIGRDTSINRDGEHEE